MEHQSLKGEIMFTDDEITYIIGRIALPLSYINLKVDNDDGIADQLIAEALIELELI